MFSRETVLVLGAGASAPYGFPCGNDLVRYIIKEGQPGGWLAPILTEMHPSRIAHGFISSLRNSLPESIDSFLEDQRTFSAIGRFAVAEVITHFEQKADLHVAQGNWYSALFNKILPTLRSKQQVKLTVVTFNYDRSLQYALFKALEARGLINRDFPFRVIHMYGSLGDLPELTSRSRYTQGFRLSEYESQNLHEIIAQNCSSIKFIHEAYDEGIIKEAQEAITQADDLFFLGFGYHDANLATLKLTQNIQGHARVLGTAYSFSEPKLTYLRQKLPHIRLAPPSLDCTKFFDEYIVFPTPTPVPRVRAL